MFIHQLRDFIQNDMNAVNAVIRQNLYSDVVLVRQISDYIIQSGGKRLRPILVLLTAGAFSYTGQDHYKLAAIVEFIHTATLLHDDVVDESTLRRGRSTANAVFGNAASVLVGDFLYSRSFQMMVSIEKMRVMQILADATNIIAEGEVLQLLNCHDPDVDEQRYMQVIHYKTAKLFEASAQLGAVIANATPDQESALTCYGRHLGAAFQLVDDILDYSGNHAEIGKNLGDDLAEGKPTLPLIHVLKNGNAAQVALVRQVIEQGGAAPEQSDVAFQEIFATIVQAIQETGALEYTRAQAQKEVDQARAAIELILPPSAHKDFLLQLAQFAVDRTS